ncbi:MAG: DUF4358 domain-containing protein [Oscillospiraceae bacterium]
MKKIISFTLAALLAVSFVACTPKDKNNTSSGVVSDINSSISSNISSMEESKPESTPTTQTGKLSTAFDAMTKDVFGVEAPSFQPIADKAQVKELTGVDVENAAVKDFLFTQPMINVQFQIFFGIEANDGKVADVEKMLKDYQAKILKEKTEFPYVDAGLEKAKGAKVVTEGNYVMYVCIANTANEEEYTQEKVDEQINKAVESLKASLKA